MKTLMDKLKEAGDRLDVEQENSFGSYEKMCTVFEKRIDLHKRFLREESLTELDRLRLESKKEWTVSHLLSLSITEETPNKISNLTTLVECRKHQYIQKSLVMHIQRRIPSF